ncbi:MAG: ATP-binding protein [Calditrichia bacterium]
MAVNLYKFKGNFKGFLFITAVLLILGFIYYTQLLVNELQQQSREFLTFKLKLFEKNINSEENQDLSFFFQEVIQTADYPIIYTDSDGVPVFWRNIDIPPVSTQPIPADTLQMLLRLVAKYDRNNEPIPILYGDNVLGVYHYGESAIIQKLRWLPYIEILIVGLFILIGYMGFSSIKKSEERFIWVGMAKETAHQLGTPLSSLIGWVEYLKSSPEKFPEVVGNIEKDLGQLQKVANRFYKIGSVPDLMPTDLGIIVSDVVEYFHRRLPANKGKIELKIDIPQDLPPVRLNPDLFSWVLENLIKNAIDAMEGKEGEISLIARRENVDKVVIDVSDSGKGISARNRKDVFKPGFSTKKRGWGLGLSLAKRIVEENHKGSLILKESAPGAGSVFRIILPLNS